ncbi:MAG: thioredoxin domain-containing protein, partial [Candidatus Omnitrophica bacterium]|nr:thioredoxin domain-containing protein [Candidatus Omnitrophota bacterium]
KVTIVEFSNFECPYCRQSWMKVRDLLQKHPQELRYVFKHFPLLVEKSVKIKTRVVESDEKEEKGLREILNFGHTVGHGIEMAYLPKFTHGESVCLGMVAESWLAINLGYAKKEILARLICLLKKYSLPWDISRLSVDRVLSFLKFDKKVKQGRWRFVLPRKIGQGETGVELEPGFVRQTWKKFSRRITNEG